MIEKVPLTIGGLIDKAGQNAVVENNYIADEEVPNLEFENAVVRRGLFVRLRMKEAKISNSTFAKCIFEDCHFRRATFKNVDFTGSLFKYCNFDRATFFACKFWYVRFYNCTIYYEDIIHAIPSEPNIAIPLLKCLRQNALGIGLKKDAEKFALRETKMEIQDIKNQIIPTPYYRKNSDYSRIGRIFKLIGLYIKEWLHGHGLKLQNIIRSGAICILAFAILIKTYGKFYYTNGNIEAGKTVILDFWKSLYLSIITFTTLGYGDYTPASKAAYIICSAESILGIVFLGFFAAAAYRKYSR